ncbi:MAG: hypothetical protein LBV19_09715 [Streptococcaceae bacterium]|nr:hypothetical protein [Streptococcaceae bacterium]
MTVLFAGQLLKSQSRIQTVKTDGGNLYISQADKFGQAASFAWQDKWGKPVSQELTALESGKLFNNQKVTGYLTFRSSDVAFVHFEGDFFSGKTTSVKLNISSSVWPASDALVDSNSRISKINGVSVRAAYAYDTRRNADMKRVKTIICSAAFKVNGLNFYLENSGPRGKSRAVWRELGSVVDQLTDDPPDFSTLSPLLRCGNEL